MSGVRDRRLPLLGCVEMGNAGSGTSCWRLRPKECVGRERDRCCRWIVYQEKERGKEEE